MLHDNKLGMVLASLLGLCVSAIIVFLILNQVHLQQKLEVAEQSLRDLTEQNRGPQGPDGRDGKDASEDQIARAVEAYCAAHNGCVGPAGAPGANGSQGPSGQSVSGPPGASVTQIKCNGTSISFYNSNGAEVGRISMVCIP